MRLFIFLLAAALHPALHAQLSEVDFNEVDSLIETTPQIDLCLLEGKEDLRFFNKAPERYADFRQVFFASVKEAITFSDTSRFQCRITAEVNCEGLAGNFSFHLEPRAFYKDEMNTFRQLIQLVNASKERRYTPAWYLGKAVNSKAGLLLTVKNGRWSVE